MIRIETTVAGKTLRVEGPDLAAAVDAYCRMANLRPASSQDLDRLMLEHRAAERQRCVEALGTMALSRPPQMTTDFWNGYAAAKRAAEQLLRKLS